MRTKIIYEFRLVKKIVRKGFDFPYNPDNSDPLGDRVKGFIEKCLVSLIIFFCQTLNSNKSYKRLT